MSAAASQSIPASPAKPAIPPVQGPVFNFRLAIGLFGILLGAMLAGLNDRVPSLASADMQGALGISHDSGSWLSTVYSAGELAAMPFATWFAITFSLRRIHAWLISIVLILAAVMPFVDNFYVLLTLRAIQGLFSGALIPLLMMAALRFLPLSIRLHGLALYALTATFAPNIALWITALCVDYFHDWRWIYWNIIPLGMIAMVLVLWGIPKMPLALPRLKQANWLSIALGIPGLALLIVGVDQGVRLDWFNSPIIVAALLTGTVLTTLFIVSEWFHPAPFIRLQLLGRRNLGLGFTAFFCLLIIMSTAVALPSSILVATQGFRMTQLAPLGLMVGLPQLILGFVVALLLYQRWVDARYLFSLGLLCMAAACWLGSDISSEWMVHQFLFIEILQCIGQPMAVVPLLFLATSVVQPMEGPYVAGIVNTIRAFGSVFGGAVIEELMHVRGNFHHEVLLNQTSIQLAHLPSFSASAMSSLMSTLAEQAEILSAADVYRIFAVIALLLIPLVLRLQYIPAPNLPPPTTIPTGTPSVAKH